LQGFIEIPYSSYVKKLENNAINFYFVYLQTFARGVE